MRFHKRLIVIDLQTTLVATVLSAGALRRGGFRGQSPLVKEAAARPAPSNERSLPAFADRLPFEGGGYLLSHMVSQYHRRK